MIKYSTYLKYNQVLYLTNNIKTNILLTKEHMFRKWRQNEYRRKKKSTG